MKTPKCKIIQITPAAHGWYEATNAIDNDGNQLLAENGDDLLEYELIALFALVELENKTTEIRYMTECTLWDNDVDLQLNYACYKTDSYVKENTQLINSALARIELAKQDKL